MFVSINHIPVADGREDDFEQAHRQKRDPVIFGGKAKVTTQGTIERAGK